MVLAARPPLGSDTTGLTGSRCLSQIIATLVSRGGWRRLQPSFRARRHLGPAALALPTRRTLLYLARRSRR